MENKQKMGISLMTLIITIVIMSILTGTILISINNGNLIDRSNTAVEQYDLKNIEQMANIAWSDAYLAGIRDENALQNHVREYFEKENINVSGYEFSFTSKGVTVKEGWAQSNYVIYKDGQEIELGEKINYIEPSSVARTSSNVPAASELEWVVLGTENGKILITTTETVGNAVYNTVSKTYTGNTNTYDPSNGDILVYSLSGMADYINNGGINKLNRYCAENYGKGEGAVGARSINVDDLNRMTGYNPEKTGDGSVSAEGTMKQYGNEVTFKLSTDGTKIGYTSAIASDLNSENLAYNKFLHVDGTKIGTVADPITNTLTEITVKNTYYNYYADTLTEHETGPVKGISKSSDLYKALFANTTYREEHPYWLASPVEFAGVDSSGKSYAYWGLRVVNDEEVATTGVFYSHIGDRPTPWFGVRPVVMLDSDVEMIYNKSTGEWDIV